MQKILLGGFEPFDCYISYNNFFCDALKVRLFFVASVCLTVSVVLRKKEKIGQKCESV